MRLAASPELLAKATSDELRIAAVFIARASAPFADDLDDAVMRSAPRRNDASRLSPGMAAGLRELEAAGQTIGAELRRRAARRSS